MVFKRFPLILKLCHFHNLYVLHMQSLWYKRPSTLARNQFLCNTASKLQAYARGSHSKIHNFTQLRENLGVSNFKINWAQFELFVFSHIWLFTFVSLQSWDLLKDFTIEHQSQLLFTFVSLQSWDLLKYFRSSVRSYSFYLLIGRAEIYC